jgi:hypothetical protein
MDPSSVAIECGLSKKLNRFFRCCLVRIVMNFMNELIGHLQSRVSHGFRGRRNPDKVINYSTVASSLKAEERPSEIG